MPATVRGPILNVIDKTIGDTLVGDHDASVLELHVNDAFDFDEDGGILRLGDEEIPYSGIDDLNDLVLLSTPTNAAWGEGTEVVALPETSEKVAIVRIANDSDAIEVRVPAIWHPMLADAIRDPEQQPIVTLRYEDDEYVLDDVWSTPKTISGEILIGDPPPQWGNIPTEPPTTAPVVEARPFAIGTVRLKVTGPLDSALQVEYEIAASLTSPVPEDGTSIVGVTRGTVLDVAQIDGVQIPFDAPTYVKARAFNTLGVGPWSDEVSATPRKADQETISAGWAYFGDVEMNQLKSGTVYSETIGIGDFIDLDGPTSTISIFGDLEHSQTLFRFGPTDPLIAVPIQTDGISALGAVILKSSESQISSGGGMTLMAGVADPKVLPTLSTGRKLAATWPAAPSGYRVRGINWDAEDTCWIRLLVPTAGTVSATCLVQKISPSGADNGYVTLTNVGGITENDFHSVVRIGTSYFTCVGDNTEPGEWYVAKFAAATGTFQALSPNNWTGITGRPCVGATNDGDLAMWQVFSNSLRVIYLSPTFAPLGFGTVVSSWTGGVNLMHYGESTYNFGFTVGNGEAALSTETMVHAFNINTSDVLVRQASYDIDLRRNVSGGGVAHRPGWGWHSISDATTLGLYSAYRNPGGIKMYATYADRAGVYTTLDSDAASLLVPDNYFVAVNLPPVPTGVTDRDVFVGFGTALPADSSMRLRPELNIDGKVLVDPAISGYSVFPPTANTFPAGSTAWIKPSAAGWALWGDGVIEVPPPLIATSAVSKQYVDDGAGWVSPGAVTNYSTPASPSLDQFVVRWSGHLISLAGVLTRTGSTLSAGATQTVAGLFPVGYRPRRQYVRTGVYGSASNTITITVETNGDLTITPNSAQGVGGTVTFPPDFTWMKA
jgi:hypothetical protein